MKKITMFYLEECPFCLAENYDYYAVPSLFIGKEKCFECTIQDDFDSIKANFKRVFDEALK